MRAWPNAAAALAARRSGVERIYTEVGELIKARREEAGQSVATVADALSVSRQQMTNWEAGRARIPLHRLYDLAAYWGTTVAVFQPVTADLMPIRYMVVDGYEPEAELGAELDQLADELDQLADLDRLDEGRGR